jgi:hypothetical protein
MLFFRRTLRHDLANMTSSAGSLVVLLVGTQIKHPVAWIGMLGFSAVTSFISWLFNLARFRMVSGVPTSRVASASQGYTELFGRAAVFPNEKPLGKRSGFPCVWFRCITERVTDGQVEQVADEISGDTFLLNDGSGQCVIDPDGAEVITTHKRVWSENNYRHTEWALRPGEPLYAIGEVITEGGVSAQLDEREDVGALLAEWKRDKSGLLARFDANRDGEIDLQEWEAARAAAQREVRQNHDDLRLQDGVHVLRRPRDGRLFLLSNLPPHKLARRYAFWAWTHVGILFAATVALLYLFTRGQ